MKKLARWIALVALLYLPFVYFVASYVFATKVPHAAAIVSMAPYACGFLLIAHLVKGQGHWCSGRGLAALPLAGIGYSGLAVIFAALITMKYI